MINFQGFSFSQNKYNSKIDKNFGEYRNNISGIITQDTELGKNKIIQQNFIATIKILL
jgi:hypothetical protein